MARTTTSPVSEHQARAGKTEIGLSLLRAFEQITLGILVAHGPRITGLRREYLVARGTIVTQDWS